MRIPLLVVILVSASTPLLARDFETLPEKVASISQVESFKPSFRAAPVAGARPLLPIALSLIKYFEGWVAHAYNDAAGYCTIGYGHLIALKRCEQTTLGEYSAALSETQGEMILEKDTANARIAVRRLISIDLNDKQFGALSSFVFNIGETNFADSTLRMLLNEKKPDLAAREFARWVKSNGKTYEGLIRRRRCEAALFVGSLELKSGKFDAAACLAFGAAPPPGSLLDIETGK